ncbi:MAG: hypothetical protein QM619_00700 [Micropruina sp.]|uniref:hypothetical protein n=1 Tax=Micropruina sp. TaxID=2737536 RepID=UPI0039E510FE
MGFWDWLTGRDPAPPVVAVPEVDPAPTQDDILASLDGVEQLISSGALPSVVRSRAARVTKLVRQTLPRLDSLGLGSYDSYSVIATATDYLPEAIGGYLRLPRDWADSRPVENGKTPLLLLIDQLDLLGATMEKIYDAANSTDAAALITHGRFLRERFGHPPAADLNVPAPPSANPADPFDLERP